MKRVLYLIKGLGRGGAEQSILNGARFHDRSRFTFELAYLLPEMAELLPDFNAAGIPVHCLGIRGVGWMKRLRSLAREREIDLVHVHSPYAAVGARMTLRGITRIVYTEHNVWDSYHPATRAGNMMTYPLNDHVIAVSDYVRRSMRYPGGLRMRMPPVTVARNGLDWDAVQTWARDDGARAALELPDGVPVVGIVANLRPQKGHRYLIEAAALVRKVIPDVRFVLLGRGALEAELRQRVADRGLQQTVLFSSYRGPAPFVMTAFDVFALPSVHEGLSIAALEAMALGRPMVVSNIGPLVELLGDPPAGLVVPVAQPEALADAILELLQDVQLRRSLSASAAQRAKAFDVRNVVERTEAIYEGLLAG